MVEPAHDDPVPDSADEPDHLANRVKLRLLMAGVDAARIEHLDEDGALESLRTRLLWGDDAQITITELAERTGLDVELCRRARMLMGLPDPGDRAACREAEIETFTGFAAGIERYGEDTILQFTRVLGSALAAIAEGAISVFGKRLSQDPFAQDLVGDAYVLSAFDALEAFMIVPNILQVVAKLQFDQAVDRLTAGAGLQRSAAIGFIDLTGSTEATERLGNDAMAPALTRFEEWAAELSVAHGGRVVKYIGDEVMYYSPDLLSAAAVAVKLLARIDKDEVLGSGRAGVAYGPVLGRDGDWYGTTVNIASRMVDKARPGSVWLTGEGAADVPDATSRGRKKLKDVPERVEIWRID